MKRNSEPQSTPIKFSYRAVIDFLLEMPSNSIAPYISEENIRLLEDGADAGLIGDNLFRRLKQQGLTPRAANRLVCIHRFAVGVFGHRTEAWLALSLAGSMEGADNLMRRFSRNDEPQAK